MNKSDAYVIINFLLGFFLLAISLRTHIMRKLAPRLRPSELDTVEATILLPVRNEEENVLSCVESLLNQTNDIGIRVIDDESTDSTRAIVLRLMSRDKRIALVDAGPLPKDWRGKVHALYVGMKDVASPWILMTDADTRHHPGTLKSVRAAMDEFKLDALSIAGFQQVGTFGEDLVIPMVFALLDAMLGDWRPAAWGNARVGNGQFMFIRRSALVSIGGLESIKNEALDDVALVEKLAENGFKVGFFRGPEWLSIRMYRGLKGTVHGWRRNLGGLFRRRIGLGLTVTVSIGLSPLLLIIELLSHQWVAAALLWLMATLSSAILRIGSKHSPLMAIFYPLDTILLLTILALGISDSKRGSLATWKGREVKL